MQLNEEPAYFLCSIIALPLSDLCGIYLNEVCAVSLGAVSAVIMKDTMMTHINEHSVLAGCMGGFLLPRSH